MGGGFNRNDVEKLFLNLFETKKISSLKDANNWLLLYHKIAFSSKGRNSFTGKIIRTFLTAEDWFDRQSLEELFISNFSQKRP